ncbi:conserved hypothetical protein [Halomonas sp. A3H3]|jgi:hypothetical protein|uniref:Uncharacterized protein n=1 Tax=Vreelandella salicampi TaxID=1449798 RepID=A0A7Z0RVQ9_9GAMM|nr:MULTISPECIES: hypothetical protein [Halomonas]NYS61853.1 hypothetical protein [Halomonas salicampi]CDG56062.1 conserved hypothetical protein [Halomonas sp. A3H3]
MGTSLHTVNPSPEQAPDESLAGRLQEYQRHRAVIEQDLRRAGITDTTPLELADRIIGDALHSAYACMVSAHRMAHAGLERGAQEHQGGPNDGEAESP